MAKKTVKKVDVEVSNVVEGVETAVSNEDKFVELFGRLAALEERVDFLQSQTVKPEAPPSETWSKAIVSNPLKEKADGVISVHAEMTPAEALELRRAEVAAAQAAAKKQGFPLDRLTQLAKELEGENISSVRPRLENLQRTGKVVDFRVIRLGSVRPMDHSTERILVTVDTVGLVVKAEVG